MGKDMKMLYCGTEIINQGVFQLGVANSVVRQLSPDSPVVADTEQEIVSALFVIRDATNILLTDVFGEKKVDKAMVAELRKEIEKIKKLP